MDNQEIRVCSACEKKRNRQNMLYTKDCHGIIVRLVCEDCYTKIMAKGYDGVYYNADEDDEADASLVKLATEW